MVSVYTGGDMDRPDIFGKFHGIDDDAWLAALKTSVRNRQYDNVVLPGFPSEATQTQFVGSSNEHAMHEGFSFFRYVKAYASALAWPISQNSKILDFGVGWGRIIRAFAKEVPPENLFGVDVDPDILKQCELNGIPGRFSTIQPTGRLPFVDGEFDIVYAYSVFSHLPENIHLHWIKEISRVLKPGGVFVSTVENHRFVEALTDPEQIAKSDWLRYVSGLADDASLLLKRYRDGEYIYIPSGGGDFRPSEVYGDSIVPEKYIYQVWNDYFHVRSYRDDADFWQSVVVCQGDVRENLGQNVGRHLAAASP
jgi:SAM-dependent methyltransferase